MKVFKAKYKDNKTALYSDNLDFIMGEVRGNLKEMMKNSNSKNSIIQLTTEDIPKEEYQSLPETDGI